jgi:y4mF family transcriptional regulator
MQGISTTSQLGDMIRKVRKEQNLTQIELAGLSGVGSRFLSELERGKASCELGKTLHILKMLGLNVSITGEVE